MRHVVSSFDGKTIGAVFAALVLVLVETGCSPSQPSGTSAPEPRTVAPASVRETVPGADLTKCGIVLRRGAEGAWDSGMVESPAVWYDEARGRYGMVYVGYGYREGSAPEPGYESVATPQIGLAWSDDLLHWTKDPAGPIFGPSGVAGAPDAAGTTGPFVWRDGGTYYLFYIGLTGIGYEAGEKTLNVATSTDLRHWERYGGNPIIAPGGEGWRRDAIWHPNIVEVGETYYLFFNASGVVDGVEEERIGYATSSDLLRWTVDDERAPLLAGSGRPGAWDASGRAGDPAVYRLGDRFYMAFYSWDGHRAQDGVAWTTVAEFPLGWRPYERNPVLTTGGAGSFDEVHAHKPFIMRTPTRHYHFYTAVDARESREIALAVSPGPCR